MTARWQCRVQVRRASDHGLIKMDPSHTLPGDGVKLAGEISRLLAAGCTLERSDAISVTLRSPTVKDEYRYIHFFREGFD